MGNILAHKAAAMDLETTLPPPDPSGLKRVLDIPHTDFLWRATYQRAWRELSKKNRSIYVKSGQRAATVADWAFWKATTPQDRPETWPKTRAEFCERANYPLPTLLNAAQKAGIARWGNSSRRNVSLRAGELADVLYDAAMEKIEAGRLRDGVAAADLWLKIHNKIGGNAIFGNNVTVNTGPQLTVNGSGGNLDERLKRLVAESQRYLDRTREGVRDAEATEVVVVGEDAEAPRGADRPVGEVRVSELPGDR